MLEIAEMKYIHGSAPMESEGTLSDGRFFYFRVRHAFATLWVGEIPFGEGATDDGQRLLMEVFPQSRDDHIWSGMPLDLGRNLLDLMVWSFGSHEFWVTSQQEESSS